MDKESTRSILRAGVAETAMSHPAAASSFWDYAELLLRVFRRLRVTGPENEDKDVDDAFEELCRYTNSVRTSRGTIFLCGNGASATMASHAAADLEKNAMVRTDVFTDPALITAVANDICFSEVFAEPLRRKMRSGDMLVAVSSSGNSPNVLKACAAARQQGGVVVTLSAMQEDNLLRKAGDVNFYVPAAGYGLAESAHALLLHYWIDRTVADAEHGA